MKLYELGINSALFKSDSKLIVNQVNENWRCKSESLQRYWSFLAFNQT